MNSDFLEPTALLDFQSPALQELIDERGWRSLSPHDRIGAAYDFVRDEIGFGYNAGDALPASQVIADGYGQCNTKTTLLMALLRALGIPCRLHGATVDKRLQKGVVNGLFYAIAPRDIIHTWAEVLAEDRWIGLEGVILDREYLRGVRAELPAGSKEVLGFAVGTNDVSAPAIDWRGTDTYIQSTAINQDFGAFPDPDAFYRRHGENLSAFRAWIYRLWIRHALNRNVAGIRERRFVATSALGSAVPSPR